MTRFFILEGHTPREVFTSLEWGDWIEAANRMVAHDVFERGVSVVTSFTGVDTGTEDDPRIFESRVFLGLFHGAVVWTSTWDDAVQAHEELRQRVIKSLGATDGNPPKAPANDEAE